MNMNESGEHLPSIKEVRSKGESELSCGKEKDDDYQLSDASAVLRKWRKQVEKDLLRTFPSHPALYDNGRDSSRRLLLTYARHNPSIGYCQSCCYCVSRVQRSQNSVD
ncbi:hypothetical protein DITRI_Ditri12bG0158300 [Diplodiscus trichospermus]